MSEALVPVVLVLLAVLAVAAFVLAVRRERARHAALVAWASAGGWHLADSDDRWAQVFDGTPFGVGDERTAEDVCTRTVDGRTQVAFSYRYVTYENVTHTNADGSTRTERRRDVHRFAVVAIQLPAPLGPVQLVREGLGQRILTALGAQDVEVEHAGFNRAYRVTAADPKHAMDLLSPRTVERLLGHQDATLRVQDGWALSWDDGRLEPAFAQRRLALLADLVAGVPRFVWRDRGHDPDRDPAQGAGR